MSSLKSPIGTHCVGYAYNLAGFLLTAGEKVILFQPPYVPVLSFSIPLFREFDTIIIFHDAMLS